MTALGRVSGWVLAEEELAAVAAEEEGEAVEVGSHGVEAVAGVADVGQQRRCEGGGVGGEPVGDAASALYRGGADGRSARLPLSNRTLVTS